MIHETAIIEATIPDSTNVWANTHISKGAVVGERCNIGENVYIGEGVIIGDGCKIQNGALLYKGVEIGNKVFIGPGVVTTNDIFPQLSKEDWSSRFRKTIIESNVSIGANSTIICGIVLGQGSMIGAGSVVTNSVGWNTLNYGNPCKFVRLINNRKDIIKQDI